MSYRQTLTANCGQIDAPDVIVRVPDSQLMVMMRASFDVRIKQAVRDASCLGEDVKSRIIERIEAEANR